MASHKKEHLQKLLEFLNDELIHEPENKWFVDELRHLIGKTDIVTSEYSEVLFDIREHCIEDIIKEQATEFYRNFSIPEIKESLIKDFMKMEMWRRRNNLQEFCLALFQQVECVVNFIASKTIVNDVSSALMSAPAYLNRDPKDISDRNYNSTYLIANLLFMRDAPVKAKELVMSQQAHDKFRTIYYFICKQARLFDNQYDDFVRETDIYREIYFIRNQNHRGNSMADWECRIDEKIRRNTTLHCFRYLDFLATFVHGVNNGYPMNNKLISYAKSFTPIPIIVKGPTILGKINLPPDNSKPRK